MSRVQTEREGLSRYRFPRFWSGWRIGWLEWSFLGLVALALGMRMWELGGRAMHYDEAIHVHYAWKLINSDGALGGWPWVFGQDFIHSPWMHGPFQIEFTAFIFRIFGDSDFTARLTYVLFGAALVGLPYFLRDYLGRAGALLTGVMLALSPAMLYFSRFGRNDILMAFWALALLILMWRYLHEGKHRYLYLAAAVLAFMFATKETAYIVTLIFGAMMFVLALPDLVPWALGRNKLSQLAGPAGFFLLLFTLTLPQWVPIVSLAQDALGVTLANRDGITSGIVGAPHWEAPFVTLPVHHGAWWFHTLLVAAMVAGLTWLNRGRGAITRFVNLGLGVPLAVVAAVSLAIFRPVDGVWSFGGAPILDFVMAGVVAGVALGALIWRKQSWQTGTLLLIWPAQLTALYAFLFTGVVNVDSIVNGVLPSGISVDATAHAVPVNYLVAAGLLLVALNVSVYLGLRWLGGRWLVVAGIFYLCWVTVYTTVFTNLAGIFSGVWQGMGYWIAQQDVARGNQPWYYYFVGLPVYEILPLVFGLLGAVYFLRKHDLLGLILAFWALITLLAYTVASEKMPWLIVNISLPFILLAGKYLGEVVERVNWQHLIRRGQVLLLIFPPLTAVAVVYLAYSFTNSEISFSWNHWALLFSAALVAAATAYLVRLARPRNGTALVTLGLAGLLLGFGTFTAVRAAYTYDDSNNELLVYAQGSKDIRETFEELNRRVLRQQPPAGAVDVDYDLWYPFNWYVRDAQIDGALRFSCFKDEDEEGWNSGCNPVEGEPDSQALLLSVTHGGRNTDALAAYLRDGPLRNLLWFYEEAYRRPGENRQEEGAPWGLKGIPNKEQITKDFGYFKSVALSKASWSDTLNYLLFRDLDGDWYNSEYYSYLPPDAPGPE